MKTKTFMTGSKLTQKRKQTSVKMWRVFPTLSNIIFSSISLWLLVAYFSSDVCFVLRPLRELFTPVPKGATAFRLVSIGIDLGDEMRIAFWEKWKNPKTDSLKKSISIESKLFCCCFLSVDYFAIHYELTQKYLLFPFHLYGNFKNY